jgi:hypothetical protein
VTTFKFTILSAINPSKNGAKMTVVEKNTIEDARLFDGHSQRFLVDCYERE